MKALIFSFLFLTICGCNQSNTNGKEKQTKDALNIDASINDSLQIQILYYEDCAYYLSETKGWIANPNPPQNSDYIKILVIYEPNSSIIHSSPMGIYSNVIFKSDYKDSTFNGFLKVTKEFALDRGEKVFKAKSIKTQDNKKAIIRKYFIDGIKEYYAIAYINEPKYIIMITYSTKNIDDFNNFYKSFEKIVQSYKSLSIIVID